MILYLKNGSGIHIKKKNRGKFTSYCGGNVTSACIAKAKRSGNPTLVKRATFAANARKWKHQQGGTLYKYQVGGYIQPQNVQEAIANGSAANGILEGFGRTMNKILPSWMQKVGTYLSPLNYAAALSKGSVNPKVGEEVISKWHPNLQLAARMGEILLGSKAVKGAGKTAVNTAAKAGNKTARAYLISKELNKGIKQNTKSGRIEVTKNYFNAPDKWYRVSERPEKIGIEQNGKNVTTWDDPVTNGTINGWRESMLSQKGRVIPGKGSNEGYFIFQPRKISLSKHGAAHGNTSQAAKGQIWQGTFAFSDRFPIGIIEGQAPMKIFRGMNEAGKDSRTNFVLQDWDKVPQGARIGFHTGEMPMSNLGWFQRTKNGTYTYEPIIPEKRITIEPSNDWTQNLPGKRDYSMLRKPSYSGHTPTKQNPVQSKFVKDVMQGHKWGMNRETRPISNKDFTELLEGKERIGYGAETSVYEHPTNPQQVLKVYPSGSNGFSSPQVAMQEGLIFTNPQNNLPYNLPVNLEGTLKRHGSYFPVFSQRKVYIPQIDQAKIIDFDKSVNGMYSLEKPNINNILLENGIQSAKDFKLSNLGFLPDGTVMGIDLWKKGGKLCLLPRKN